MDHLAHRTHLDDTAGIHHRHPVGGLGDHAHVVGDQHDAGAVLVAETAEQRGDLGLDRDIERGGRLVGDDQLRLGGERQRNDDPLAHPARELVRLMVDPLGRRRDADLGQQVDRTGTGRPAAQAEMQADGLDQLLSDREERVQRGQRILEDRADLAAAHLLHRPVAEPVDAPAADVDLARGDAPRRLEQPQNGKPGHRLAGAGIADDAQDFAGRDAERDVR